MFKRIIYDGWTDIIPHISFWLTFGVFIAICIYAIWLKKGKVHHMEELPLQDDETSIPSSASKK